MTTKKRVRVICTFFADIMLISEMWLVPHANERRETIVMRRETDVGSEALLTSFCVAFPGLAAVSCYVLTTDFTPRQQED